MSRAGHRNRQAGGPRRPAEEKDSPSTTPEKRAGDELTHYEPKKHAQAIAVRRLAKVGKPARKIAKDLGLPLNEVKEILAR